MTRTHTASPVWTWKCDRCGREESLARVQQMLPKPDEMRGRGWFIAKTFGDLCWQCVADDRAAAVPVEEDNRG